MQTVSREFKEAVYAPARKTTAEVSFEILDNEAYGDNASKVTSEAPISRKDQLTDKIRTMSHKYATFERDYFKLDGSFYIPPKPTEEVSKLGWWSGGLSDENGMFSPYQVLEFDFTDEHNSMGLTITFDTKGDEYASDFDIEVFGLDGALIHMEEVLDNDKSTYVLVLGLDDYAKVRITIKKWAKPYRRVRIAAVDFGVVQNYGDDGLIKLSIIEEMDSISDAIPSNEIKFTIDNSSKDFNILNPEGFYRFLMERQEVEAKIGVEVKEDEFEFIPMGKFYLTDWQSDEGALTTTLTARDVFDLLETEEYLSINNTNLYDLAEDILTNANIEKYTIDEALRDIPTVGFVQPLNSREALQFLGVAGKCAIHQDRQGAVQIKRLETLEEGVFLGMTVDTGQDMQKITFDNVYEKPQIKLDKLIKSIDIVTSNYSVDEHKEIVDMDVEILGEETVFIDYKTPVKADSVNIVVTGAENHHEVEKYNMGVKLYIKANGTVNIRVNGDALLTNKTTYGLLNDDVKDGITLQVDNPLINSPEHALDVSKWLMNEYDLRAVYDISWRQNPLLECNDVVLIEDSYDVKRLSRIIKQEFEYAGYLSGKTEAKGGV